MRHDATVSKHNKNKSKRFHLDTFLFSFGDVTNYEDMMLQCALSCCWNDESNRCFWLVSIDTRPMFHVKSQKGKRKLQPKKRIREEENITTK